MERMIVDPDKVVASTTKTAFEELYAAEVEVRERLNLAGVSMIQYPFYLNFGRELWKLVGRISGEGAAVESDILAQKWSSRGLDPALLADISFNVFGIAHALPELVVYVRPENHEIDVPRTGFLTWLAAKYATGYDVHLGPHGTEPLPELSHDQPGLTYHYGLPVGLLPDTEYDWYIVGRNKYGVSAYVIYSFTTAGL
jgi:hypothetical protein